MASDEQLAAEIRKGNEAAFAAAYERFHRGLFAMCRRMLGSSEDAEEVLQQSLTSAWLYLQRDDRAAPVQLKPWLYAVARNRCLSELRARRPAMELPQPGLRSELADQVERRAELRALLEDVTDLPKEQRTALVMSELMGLSHADIAGALGRHESRVKSLVFQARSTLADWREARDQPCDEIREQLTSLRGGALRRRALRRHLQLCDSCRTYRAELRVRRGGVALLLPWLPKLGHRVAVTLWSPGAAGAVSNAISGEGTFEPLMAPAATMAVAGVAMVAGFGGGPGSRVQPTPLMPVPAWAQQHAGAVAAAASSGAGTSVRPTAATGAQPGFLSAAAPSLSPWLRSSNPARQSARDRLGAPRSIRSTRLRLGSATPAAAAPTASRTASTSATPSPSGATHVTVAVDMGANPDVKLAKPKPVKTTPAPPPAGPKPKRPVALPPVPKPKPPPPPPAGPKPKPPAPLPPAPKPKPPPPPPAGPKPKPSSAAPHPTPPPSGHTPLSN